VKACEEDGRNCAVAWWQSKSCQNQSPKRQLCSALAPAPKPPIDNCEKRKKKGIPTQKNIKKNNRIYV